MKCSSVQVFSHCRVLLCQKTSDKLCLMASWDGTNQVGNAVCAYGYYIYMGVVRLQIGVCVMTSLGRINAVLNPLMSREEPSLFAKSLLPKVVHCLVNHVWWLSTVFRVKKHI